MRLTFIFVFCFLQLLFTASDKTKFELQQVRSELTLQRSSHQSALNDLKDEIQRLRYELETVNRNIQRLEP